MRRWISGFFRKNNSKIKDLYSKLIMIATVVFAATIFLSFTNTMPTETKEIKSIYKPTKTIIKGSNVSESQYTLDKDLVEKFIDYCNNKKVEEAYNLLNNDCKQELYPTLEVFVKNYYNDIFQIKREYNLQSWMTTKDKRTYKIRYTNDIMSSGKYEKENVYEDYITITKEDGKEKISVGSFISSKDLNISTKTDIFDADVIKKKQYLTEEVYVIKIKNKSEKTVLLDDLKSNTINLITNNIKYKAPKNEMFAINLMISPGEIKTIELKFKKSYSSSDNAKEIEFEKIITDYETYKKEQNKYTNTNILRIKLEE